MRSRPERFGAWVRIDDGTLVAIDRTLARALHLDGGALWNDALPAPVARPLEVHVAVTARCPAGCSGCYQSATLDGEHVSLDALTSTLDALSAMGVFTVAFGGGEPMLRDDLGALATLARARGLVPVVTTSGIGLTREKTRTLVDFAQVNVSHDGVGGGYEAVRGYDGEAVADRALRTLLDAGVTAGVNHVLTRQNFDHLAATADHARALGARELQVLRYKPAGRAASLDYLARRLTLAQRLALAPSLQRIAETHGEALSIRVDCATIPLLSQTITDARALERFGVFGCEAGRHLGAVRRDGSLAGCSFVTEPVDTGTDGTLDARWEHSRELGRFRASVAAPAEPCAHCPLRGVCRGGCRIVSEHLAGGFAPDPECPRVVSHASGETPVR